MIACIKHVKISNYGVKYIQLKSDETTQLPNKHYVNEVTLIGQNPPSKYCWPPELLTQSLKGLDLSMLKIWNL